MSAHIPAAGAGCGWRGSVDRQRQTTHSKGKKWKTHPRQRSSLRTTGPNHETRQRSRQFFYTVMVLELLTLVVNYIVGITSSMAASHIEEVGNSVSMLSLSGLASRW